MVGVPTAIPVTIPVADPTEPCAGALLDQVPPVEELLKVVVEPIQTLFVPVIDAGNGFIVTVAVASAPQGLATV